MKLIPFAYLQITIKNDLICPEENMVDFLFLWAKIFSTHVRKTMCWHIKIVLHDRYVLDVT